MVPVSAMPTAAPVSTASTRSRSVVLSGASGASRTSCTPPSSAEVHASGASAASASVPTPYLVHASATAPGRLSAATRSTTAR